MFTFIFNIFNIVKEFVIGIFTGLFTEVIIDAFKA